MRTVEREFTREVDASVAAVVWNYFDTEHLTVAHSGYTDAKVLYQEPPVQVLLQTYRVPGLPFLKSHSMSTLVIQELSDERLRFQQYNLGLLAMPTISSFDVRALGPDRASVTVRYKFLLRGWRRLLTPLLHRLMERWNERVWREDLSLKLRRHKVLRLGFKDFVGLPDKIADREREGVLPARFPVPRPKESPLHDFLEASPSKKDLPPEAA